MEAILPGNGNPKWEAPDKGNMMTCFSCLSLSLDCVTFLLSYFLFSFSLSFNCRLSLSLSLGVYDFDDLFFFWLVAVSGVIVWWNVALGLTGGMAVWLAVKA